MFLQDSSDDERLGILRPWKGQTQWIVVQGRYDWRNALEPIDGQLIMAVSNQNG